MKIRIGGAALELLQGDITDLAVDAIVNPANRALQLGGGVAGAIARRGGPAVQEECDRIGPIAVGAAAITTGGSLPARHVIHAVGPRFGEPDDARNLAEATRSALRVADEHGLRSIALPAISTGIFGYPRRAAAEVAVATTRAANPAGIELVRFVAFDAETQRDYEDLLG